jgi:UDP-N-acetylmuramate dehydrogenase
VGVQAIDIQTNEVVYLSADDCQFSYRSSIFKQKDGRSLIITAVDFKLNRDASVNTSYPTLKAALHKLKPSHRDVYDAVIKVRSQRLPDPTQTPNVGSFFKNPLVTNTAAERLRTQFPLLPQYETDSNMMKLSAAWMIDDLGWRGKEVDGVAVSEAHSLVLVNRAATSSVAVLSLAEAIQQSVLQKFGVELVIEPEVLGVSGDSVK